MSSIGLQEGDYVNNLKTKLIKNVPTHLGRTIDSVLEEKILYDKNIKELLSDIQVLAYIAKYTVEEVQHLTIEEIMGCIEKDKIEVGIAEVEPGRSNQTDDYIISKLVDNFKISEEKAKGYLESK